MKTHTEAALGGDVMEITNEQIELLLPKTPMTRTEFLDALRSANEGKEYKDIMSFDAKQAAEDRAFIKSVTQAG